MHKNPDIYGVNQRQCLCNIPKEETGTTHNCKCAMANLKNNLNQLCNLPYHDNNLEKPRMQDASGEKRVAITDYNTGQILPDGG